MCGHSRSRRGACTGGRLGGAGGVTWVACAGAGAAAGCGGAGGAMGGRRQPAWRRRTAAPTAGRACRRPGSRRCSGWWPPAATDRPVHASRWTARGGSPRRAGARRAGGLPASGTARRAASPASGRSRRRGAGAGRCRWRRRPRAGCWAAGRTRCRRAPPARSRWPASAHPLGAVRRRGWGCSRHRRAPPRRRSARGPAGGPSRTRCPRWWAAR